MSSRTDVDGLGLCSTCLKFVGDDDVCDEDCAQGELARVLKYIADRIGDGDGRVYDDLRELHAELQGGAHR